MIPEVEIGRIYYIYNDKVYKYREDIEELYAEDYIGLDDDLTDSLEELEIEEVNGIELLNRIGDESLCLMW